jgi:hypothetical protein
MSDDTFNCLIFQLPEAEVTSGSRSEIICSKERIIKFKSMKGKTLKNVIYGTVLRFYSLLSASLLSYGVVPSVPFTLDPLPFTLFSTVSPSLPNCLPIVFPLLNYRSSIVIQSSNHCLSAFYVTCYLILYSPFSPIFLAFILCFLLLYYLL